MTEAFDQRVARLKKERQEKEERHARKRNSDSSDYQPPNLSPFTMPDFSPSPSYDQPSMTPVQAAPSSDSGGFSGGESGGGGSSDSW